MKTLINYVLDFVFPRRCCVCGVALNRSEKHICISCAIDIPVTNLHRVPFNRVEQLFAGHVRMERASALFYYHKQSPYSSILHDLKYRNTPQLGEFIAKKLSVRLQLDGFFHDIDYIIPIPLHYTKESERGYNQSLYISKGISDTSGIPIIRNTLIAKEAHDTQTHKHRNERWQNTRDIFDVKHSEQINGKHILLVDDVITTGATMISAAKTITESATDVKISALSLALAND